MLITRRPAEVVLRVRVRDASQLLPLQVLTLKKTEDVAFDLKTSGACEGLNPGLKDPLNHI